jgi:hypothetical protein
MTRRFVVLGVLSLALAACSSSAAIKATTTTTTTTLPPTTTTTTLAVATADSLVDTLYYDVTQAFSNSTSAGFEK